MENKNISSENPSEKCENPSEKSTNVPFNYCNLDRKIPELIVKRINELLTTRINEFLKKNFTQDEINELCVQYTGLESSYGTLLRLIALTLQKKDTIIITLNKKQKERTLNFESLFSAKELKDIVSMSELNLFGDSSLDPVEKYIITNHLPDNYKFNTINKTIEFLSKFTNNICSYFSIPNNSTDDVNLFIKSVDLLNHLATKFPDMINQNETLNNIYRTELTDLQEKHNLQLKKISDETAQIKLSNLLNKEISQLASKQNLNNLEKIMKSLLNKEISQLASKQNLNNLEKTMKSIMMGISMILLKQFMHILLFNEKDYNDLAIYRTIAQLNYMVCSIKKICGLSLSINCKLNKDNCVISIVEKLNRTDCHTFRTHLEFILNEKYQKMNIVLSVPILKELMIELESILTEDKFSQFYLNPSYSFLLVKCEEKAEISNATNMLDQIESVIKNTDMSAKSDMSVKIEKSF